MNTPTLAEVRAASPLVAQKLPPDGGGANDTQLALWSDEAAALVATVTFRLIGPVTESTVEGWAFADVPSSLVPVAVRAISLMVERLVVTGDASFAQQLATGRLLRGFSAGPYSESYFAPGEFARRGAAQGRPPMDQDERLDMALWALATEDAREYFVFYASGAEIPAQAVISWDYRRQNLGYSSGSLGGWPARGGPDGY